MRAWIDAYVPDNPSALSPLPEGPDEHVMFAADVWYGLKKHWALEAQSVRARPTRAAVELGSGRQPIRESNRDGPQDPGKTDRLG